MKDQREASRWFVKGVLAVESAVPLINGCGWERWSRKYHSANSETIISSGMDVDRKIVFIDLPFY